MSYGEMSSTRESAKMCTIILQNPDDMVLWLKFASDNLTINSACTDDHIIQLNHPERIPNNRG